MIKKLAIGLGVVIVILLVVVWLQPSAFVVERTTLIEAPPDVVYPHIASLKQMDVWSPWVKMDSELKLQYEGPDSGVGARSTWEGPQMGKGRLTVTEVDPVQSVNMQLEMLEPFATSNDIVFLLEPKPAGTEVTWRMKGRNGFFGKLMSLVMGMDAMIGEPFEQGLAALKSLAETEARGRAAG